MKDAYYFPHFSNARNDRKILRLRKELGVEGYGVYFMTLEVLRDQKDYKYPLEDLDLLADEFKISEPKLRTVVCNYDLFKVDDNEWFFSPKFVDFMKPLEVAREQRRLAGIASGKARKAKKQELGNDRSTSVERVLNENEQSKVKKTKVKKTKTNKRKVDNTSDNFFIAPSLNEVIKFFEDNNYDRDDAIKAYEYYDERKWVDGNNKPVKSWKLKMRKVWFKPENKKSNWLT